LSHTAASKIGPASSRQRLIRPVRSWVTSPARTKTWMCFDTACSEMSKGPAISDTKRSLPSSRAKMARRTGSDSAAKTVSRRVSSSLLDASIKRSGVVMLDNYQSFD